jgi:Yip1 domain
MKTFVWSVFTAWFMPRTTLRRLAERPWNWTPLLFAWVNGARFFFDQVGSKNAFDYFDGVDNTLLMAAIVGPVLGIAVLDLTALVFFLTGRLVGGTGDFARVRAAVSLSYVPMNALFLLLAAGLLLFASSEATDLLVLMDDVGRFVILIWGFVIGLQALAEAHRVSVWRAFKLILIVMLPMLIVLTIHFVGSPKVWLWFFLILSMIALVGLLVGHSVYLISSILSVGRTPRWMARLANRRAFVAPNTVPFDDSVYGAKTRWVLFPFAAEFCVLVGMFLISSWLPILLRKQATELFSILAPPLLFTGYTLLGLAWLYHLDINSHRRLKYELAMCGLTVLFFMYRTSLLVERTTTGQLPLDSRHWWEETCGEYMAPAIWWAAFGAVFAGVFRYQKATADPPSTAVRWLYRATRKPFAILSAVIAVVAINPQLYGFAILFGVYLALRFVLMERMFSDAIVYLRSFHDKDAALAFGRIVMPVAVPRAPVVAITHTIQPPEQLQSEMQVDTLARLHTSGGSEWKAWVIDRLTHCPAAVIDVTHSTEGVLWELEQAYQIVPPERIAILAREGVEVAPAREGVFLLRYGLTFRERWKARKALARWLKAVARLPRARQPEPVALQFERALSNGPFA